MLIIITANLFVCNNSLYYENKFVIKKSRFMEFLNTENQLCDKNPDFIE